MGHPTFEQLVPERSVRSSSGSASSAHGMDSEAHDSNQFEIVPIHLDNEPLPLEQVSDKSPAFYPKTQNPNGSWDIQYPNKRVKAFADLIPSLSGLVVLSPEYNGSIPGGLKNAIDNLCLEWKDMPVVTVTYGIKGEAGSSTTLKQIFEVLKVDDVSCGEIKIPIPMERYIMGTDLVQGNEAFLDEYEAPLLGAFGKLVEKAAARS